MNKEFYHVTSRDNLNSILKNGLQASYSAKSGSASSRSTIKESIGRIYLTSSIDNLPMKLKQDKVLLKISVPEVVYKTWDVKNDPIYDHYKDRVKYADDWTLHMYNTYPNVKAKIDTEIMTKQIPGSLKFALKKTDFYKKVLASWDGILPGKTVTIGNDINPKYISVVTGLK